MACVQAEEQLTCALRRAAQAHSCSQALTQHGIRFGKQLLAFVQASPAINADLGALAAICVLVCRMIWQVPHRSVHADHFTGLALASVRGKLAELEGALQAAAVSAKCAGWLPLSERYAFALEAAECVA